MRREVKDTLENIALGLFVIVFLCLVVGLVAGICLAFVAGHYVIGGVLAIPVVIYIAYLIGDSM